MLTEVVDTLILQTNTIQHTTGSLSHTWIVISLTRIQCCTLYDDATYTVKGHKISKFQTIAKSAGCRHYGVLQRKTAYLYI